jgi:xanthine dehydrogenase accessory factor
MIVLVRGSGDVGSAAAHVLFQAGYKVLIHETPQPAVTRRKMAFTDAVFDGNAILEGVEARRVDDMTALSAALSERRYIPLATMEFFELLGFLRPWALVDARMRKRAQPERQIHLADFTIGLGPNFIAGETVHLAVETGWGEDLGKVIKNGSTRPLQGEPREIEGHARDRYVYAPADGVFCARLQIGDRVEAGQEVARLDGISLAAPIRGVLRGLTRDGVFVFQKTKVVEIDPRVENAQVSGIAERPARIAEGVLRAVQGMS